MLEAANLRKGGIMFNNGLKCNRLGGRRAGILLFAIFATGVLLTVTTAQEPASKDPARNPAKKSASQPAVAGGLRVFIDPATGKIREPEQEELQALSRAVGAPTRVSSASQFVLSNGAVGAQVDPSLWSYSVATTGPDGKVSTACVKSLRNAEAKIHAPAREALDVR
jgi:hypothetical protein